MIKKITTLFFGLLLTVLLFSCDRKEDLNDVKVLKEKIHASQDFKNYKYAMQELTDATIRGEISVKIADKEAMKQASLKVKSVNEYAINLEKAGVIGSKKLAELLYLKQISGINLFKDNPELKKYSRSELVEILELDIKPNLSENHLKK
jgi:CRISPR/Cas system-associated exonuclease Cas4 (RecB family)